MPRIQTESSVRAFAQHGFIQERLTDTQVVGTCPFCHKSNHFFINKKSNNWDCKSCQRKGGYQTFLAEIVKFTKQYFKGKQAIELSKNRGLKIRTLKEAQIGFNPINNTFLLPVVDSNNSKIWDIRIYNYRSIRSTAGCHVGLYGWDQLSDPKSKNVFLCEGEWDCLAMREIIESQKVEDSIAIAVPGAGTFKSDWSLYLKDKVVIVLYDNDNAGREGSRKVYNSLKMIAKELKFLHWNDAVGEGGDIRDLYIKRGSGGTLKFIKKSSFEQPEGIEDLDDEQEIEISVNPQQLTGEGLPAEEVYKKYKKWLRIPKTDVIDVIYGTIIANRLPGDPLWLFLVAPSGATKTEFLMSLTRAPGMVTTTTLTPHALISGANVSGGRDPSILRMMNGRILLIKDFTTILSMLSALREEIFGILRDAYDGRIEKRFGNGIYRIYDPCKFGIVAGVTPAIELFTEEHTALGERFLRYKVPLSDNLTDQRDIIRRAVMNTTKEDKMRSELQTVGEEVLNFDFDEIPEIPDYIIDRVLCLSQWTALMRATIIRDRFTKEITHRPFAELGTRLAKQFCKLLLGIAMFKRIPAVTEEEYKIVKDIAIGTVPGRMESVISHIMKVQADGRYETNDIAQMVGLPLMTVKRVIENLSLLGIVEKEKLSNIKFRWGLTESIIGIMEKAELYN